MLSNLRGYNRRRKELRCWASYVKAQDRMIVRKQCHSKSVIGLIAQHRPIVLFADVVLTAWRDPIGAFEELCS